MSSYSPGILWGIVLAGSIWCLLIITIERFAPSWEIAQQSWTAISWLRRTRRSSSATATRTALRNLAFERRLLEEEAWKVERTCKTRDWAPFVQVSLKHSSAVIGQRMLGETKNPPDENTVAGLRAYSAGAATHLLFRDFGRLHDSLSRLSLVAALPAGSPILSKAKYDKLKIARPSLDQLDQETRRLRPLRLMFAKAARKVLRRTLANYSRLDLLAFLRRWSSIAQSEQDPELFLFLVVLYESQRNIARISRLGGSDCAQVRVIGYQWIFAIVEGDLNHQYELAVKFTRFLADRNLFRNSDKVVAASA